MTSSARMVMFLVLIVGLMAAAYYLAFKPRQQRLAAAKVEIQQKKAQLTQLEKAVASQSSLADETEKLKHALAIFEQKLPEQREMDNILREVSQTAEKNGLTVKSVRTLKAVYGDRYSEQPIRMEIVGPFKPGFYQFLASVESMQRITRINDMTLQKDPKVEGQAVADFVLTVFFDSANKDAG